MRKRYIAYVMILASTIAVSFIAGYFTTLRYAEKKLKDNPPQAQANNSAVAQTMKIPVSEVINQSTVIEKQDRYTNGTGFVKKSIENASAEVIGMDLITAEKYFESLGYKVIKFSPEKEREVIVLKEINDIWPANCYVIKEDSGFVAIFEVKEDGSLSLQHRTEIKVEKLPQQDRDDIIKGKIYETREAAESTIEEDYNS